MASLRFLCPVIFAAGLSACATPNQIVEGPRPLLDTKIEEREPRVDIMMQDAVNFFSEKPITVLESGATSNFRIEATASDPVPDILVREINAAPLALGAVLSLISDQTGLDWRIEGLDAKTLISAEIYFVQRSPAPLGEVLAALARLTDSLWRIDNGRIVFSRTERYFARAPRMANSLDIIEKALIGFGASDVFADPLSGTISFKATRSTFEAANRMFESFEHGRDMIVYDFWLIDRSLNDGAGIGVNLDAVAESNPGTKIAIGGAGFLDGVGGVVNSVGLSGAIGALDIASTLSFLRTLGDVRTISRPSLAMLSGGASKYQSTQVQSYVREISRRAVSGTSVSDPVLGGVANDTETTTQVEDLETGLIIDVEGSFSSGVVSSAITVDVSELIAFEDFDTGDVQLRLPNTTSRIVTANMEARPGDVMVLAGIIRDREDRKGQEITGVGAPTGRSVKVDRIETIVFVRPRVVQIRNVKSAPAAQVAIARPEVSSPRTTSVAAEQSIALGVIEQLEAQ